MANNGGRGGGNRFYGHETNERASIFATWLLHATQPKNKNHNEAKKRLVLEEEQSFMSRNRGYMIEISASLTKPKWAQSF